MRKIISVKFKPTGKGYYFDPLNFNIKKGDHVIVETTRGIEYGTASSDIKEVEESELHSMLKSVLRIATKEDDIKYKKFLEELQYLIDYKKEFYELAEIVFNEVKNQK